MHRSHGGDQGKKVLECIAGGEARLGLAVRLRGRTGGEIGGSRGDEEKGDGEAFRVGWRGVGVWVWDCLESGEVKGRGDMCQI
jgi:hypothetical protein